MQMMRANTLFTYVCYHPAEHQILTSGTDRKIAYWEAYDGSMIRELDGSQGGSINTMDISSDGRFFVSAGDDRIVKVKRPCIFDSFRNPGTKGNSHSCVQFAHSQVTFWTNVHCSKFSQQVKIPAAGVGLPGGRGDARWTWSQRCHSPSQDRTRRDIHHQRFRRRSHSALALSARALHRRRCGVTGPHTQGDPALGYAPNKSDAG